MNEHDQTRCAEQQRKVHVEISVGDRADASACREIWDGGVVARGARAESKLGQKLGHTRRPLRATTPAPGAGKPASCLHRNPKPHLTRHNHHLAAYPERAQGLHRDPAKALGTWQRLPSIEHHSVWSPPGKKSCKSHVRLAKLSSSEIRLSSAGMLDSALRLSLPWHPRAGRTTPLGSTRT